MKAHGSISGGEDLQGFEHDLGNVKACMPILFAPSFLSPNAVHCLTVLFVYEHRNFGML